MMIRIERRQQRGPTDTLRFRVVLDLMDGRMLKSEELDERAAVDLQHELERRIFVIGEGVKEGPRDRM